MGFNSNVGKVSYTISNIDTKVYTFNFKIFDASDLTLYYTPDGQLPDDNADKLVINTDYTVVINGDVGGFVTLSNTLTVNSALSIYRELEIDREYEYTPNGGIYSTDLNNDQDYQTYMISDGLVETERAIRLGRSVVGVSTELPPALPSQYLRWNDDATGIINDGTYPAAIKEAIDSAGRSEASRLTADSYATEPEDVFVKLFTYDPATETISNVDTIEYSAFHYSEKSDEYGELRNWEAEAKVMTANSYAIEPEDTFVKIWTSLGDGTFESVDTTEYSSLHWAAKSDEYGELRMWEAEANALTSDSYANEAEDVFVKIYTSNGDGTFSSTDSTEYSSFHYSEKSDQFSVFSDERATNSWNDSKQSEAEKLTSDSYATEDEDVPVKIYNWDIPTQLMVHADVDPLEYSAKHYKLKAEDAVSGGIGMDGLTDVDTLGIKNEDLIVYNENDSQYYPMAVQDMIGSQESMANVGNLIWKNTSAINKIKIDGLNPSTTKTN